MTSLSSSSATPILRARQLGKRVNARSGTLTILSGVELVVNPGESVAILGASGSGKSTLLGLLAGLDTESDGEVELNGISLKGLNEDQRAEVRADGVGFVFQSFQLLPALTALENVLLPLELSGYGAAQSQASRLLQAVGLSGREDHYPRQLSGGEQQRVAIARAFASQPKILFADEPTGNLDSHTGEAIIQLLFDLNRREHTTLVLVTHDAQLAARCQRRLQLVSGQLETLA
ncbi:ABC transporter ATP-binding protein [Motiliproteus sediminis]|uniref:ABC transporter ATP-binding protein n=1 Tax=Motiliproteus sediminis TaxID=1468178 RepID=UPI001AEFD998|nr:ABC transporter ATP-binding protein [Motiliproteus sediminis]